MQMAAIHQILPESSFQDSNYQTDSLDEILRRRVCYSAHVKRRFIHKYFFIDKSSFLSYIFLYFSTICLYNDLTAGAMNSGFMAASPIILLALG